MSRARAIVEQLATLPVNETRIPAFFSRERPTWITVRTREGRDAKIKVEWIGRRYRLTASGMKEEFFDPQDIRYAVEDIVRFLRG